MLCRHSDAKLQRMETEAAYKAGYADAIVNAFRRRMQTIRAAKNETDFYALKSLHFEKLKGNRQHQHSMRLNQQYRLILQIEPGTPGNTIVVVGIEDYH